MRKPITGLAIGLGILGQSGHLAAVGLGGIRLESALYQPLAARIELLDTVDLSTDEMLVGLASSAEFERADIERAPHLAGLRFAVRTTDEGAVVVDVTSDEPVREPYLNFLVELVWPDGRLVREYTLLLDPPSYRAPTLSASAPAPTAIPSESVPAPAIPDRAAPQVERPQTLGLNQYRVSTQGETLWGIASKVRPSESVSVQQTMLAIQDRNPNAFLRGNINLLKQSVVLDVPTLDEVQARSQAQAIQAVQAQVNDWERIKSGRPPVAPSLTTEAQPTTAPPDVDAELKLVASTDSTAQSPAETTAQGGTAPAEEVEALSAQLALSLENVDLLTEENRELGERFEDLNQQLATLQKLLNLKDQQLAALEQELVQRGAETPSDALAPVPGGAPEVADPPTGSLFETALAWAQKSWMLVAAAVGGVGLLLLLALRRRGANKDAHFIHDPELDEPAADPFVQSEGLPEAWEGDGEDGDNVRPIGEPESLNLPEPDVPQPASDAVPVSAQTSDALSEADIYLAYGRLQPAISILTSAIEEEPRRADLRLKLAEVYADQGNREAFDEQKRAIDEWGDPVDIQRAAELKTRLGGAGPTDPTARPETSDLASESFAPLEFDSERDLDAQASAEDERPNLKLDVSAEDGFGIEPEAPLNEEPMAAAADAPSGMAMEPLDFDTSFLDEAASGPASNPSIDDSATESEAAPFAPAETENAPLDFDFELPDSFDQLDDDRQKASPALSEGPADGFDVPLGYETNEEQPDDLDSVMAEAQQQAAEFLNESDQPLMAEEETPAITPEPIPVEGAPVAGEVSEQLGHGDAAEGDLDYLGEDENATKLNLARAYIDMGDEEGARDILQEVLQEGDAAQRQEAEGLMQRLS